MDTNHFSEDFIHVPLHKLSAMSSLNNIQPQEVWKHFEALNAVPRASKKEERVRKFAIDYGHSLGLETYEDPIGNVIIKKPGTKGKENATPIILQAHLDMVHQKNADTQFDFDTQGIQMYVDGDWVRAKGTTLGADNGLGVAMIMAVLESTDINHAPIEALFTIDEETGMTGAKELERGILNGKILLNLDTEEDDEFTIGCAGGIDTTIHWKYNQNATTFSNYFKLSVRGLKGGHSGTDIHLGLGNANKILTRILINAENVEISSMEGGSLRNAIPREAFATVAVQDAAAFSAHVAEISALIKEEFAVMDAGLTIDLESFVSVAPLQVMNSVAQFQLLNALQACHNGVYRMSPDIQGLVEASSNLARIQANDGNFVAMTLQRSSVESSKQDVANTVASAFRSLNGVEIEHSGSYPGWKPNPHSPVLATMVKMYQATFGGEPKVAACHAGLECGILGERYPGLDMISFGPTIRGAHSPDERASVSSLQKSWSFLKEVLNSL